MKLDEKSTPDAPASDARLFDGSSEKPKRTPGLWAFDAMLYPGITNVGVFASSVFFTYLTNRGEHFGKPGSSARWIGENIFKKRGEWMKENFMKAGLKEESANNAKMVFWSFFDGSLLAPAIKWFEDDREIIARKIDQIGGTQPEDDSVYQAEPKQTWGSILGGRAITAVPVVLTAVQLDKATHGKSFNQKLFYEPGIKLGNWVAERNPDFAKKFSPETFHEISKVTLFEAFYTSVCTAGLYVTSRTIARLTGNTHGERGSEASNAQRENALRLSALMQPPRSTDAPENTSPEANPDTKLDAQSTQHTPLKQRDASLSA